MNNAYETNFLGGVMADDVSIQDWLLKIKETFPSECSYLLENSKEYKEVLPWYPIGFPEPKFCNRDDCHRNAMLYLIQLQESHPSIAEQVQYVTGFVKASCLTKVVQPGLLHIITRHSFLLYNGYVFDITYLRYPPLYYEVNQYFGVAFHSGLMDVPWYFEEKRGLALGVMDFVRQEGNPFMMA